MKHYVQILLVVLSLMLLHVESNAQKRDTAFQTRSALSMVVESPSSDRWAYVSWSGFNEMTEFFALPQGTCDVSDGDNPPSTYAFVNVESGEGDAGDDRLELPPGFSETVSWYTRYFDQNAAEQQWKCVLNDDDVEVEGLRRPGNLNYTEGYGFSSVQLTWTGETDWDDADVKYRVFAPSYPAYYTTEDGVSGIAYADLDIEVSGSHRSIVLYGLDPNVATSYYYSVSTYQVPDNKGSTKSNQTAYLPTMTATDAAYIGRTKLEWTTMALIAEAIRIKRSIPGGGTEEIAILDKNATSYNDYDGIPGYIYTYTMEALDDQGNVEGSLTDTGSSLANGRISGQVISSAGVGVSGVDIEVSFVNGYPSGGPGTTCTSDTYCTTTDTHGYYEIDNIYYKTDEEVQITPSLATSGHTFTPSSRIRTLTLEDRSAENVDFVDETAITVSGTVMYGDSCGVEGASIFIEGEDTGIETASDGTWSTTLSDPGIYDFSVEYYDHVYVDTAGNQASSLYLQASASSIDFYNTTKRTVEIVAQGGCELSLGSAVLVQVTHSDGCFTQFSDSTASDGILVLSNLEPREDYTFEVIGVSGPNISPAQNIIDQFDPVAVDLLAPGTYSKIQIVPDTTFIPEVLDTLPGDSTGFVLVPADTVITTLADTIDEPFPTIRFIYRSDIDFDIDFVATGAEVFSCSGTLYDGVPIVEQLVEYDLEVTVYEDLGSAGQCPIDQGSLLIYDQVSDKESSGVEVDVVNGIAHYKMIPRSINTDSSGNHPFQKYLYLYPKVDFVEGISKDFWILVEGLEEHNPTFFTGTPEIPQLIIHDPPGDNSYAFVESGTSFTTFNSTSVLTSDGGSTYEETSVGLSAEIEILSVDFSDDISVTVESGTNINEESGYFTTYTFNETFSTSALENYTNEDGDVYIGAAYNQSYALSPELTFDENVCQGELDTILTMAVDEIATTFVYSELHIRNTLLPQLSLLMSQESDSVEYYKLQADSTAWADILAQNEANRSNLSNIHEGNISVSAGAQYSRSYGVTNGVNVSYEYSTYLNEETLEEVGGSVSLVVDFSSDEGGMVSTQYESSEVFDSTSEETRLIGYVVEDNDLGDFFSFDVYTDPDYDTPIFANVQGTTSCPNEPGTQPRDKPAIKTDKPLVDNVPLGGQARFVCTITNNSQSGEAREYAVRVVSATNPDGAYVAIGGNGINFFPASIFIAAGQSVDFVLTVDAGPVANTYDDIEIMVYPPCEYELWQDGGTLLNADTVTISAHFQSECSEISITDPTSDWIVNQQSDDTLNITIGGFDVNNEKFDEVTVWVQPDGQGYSQVDQIPVSSLTTPYTLIPIDLSSFNDGGYTVKVSADCDNGADRTFSNEVPGIIDRSSVAPFGVPSPSDGYLQFGDEISVTFDKNIDATSLNSAEITLIRTDDSTDISFSTSVVGNVVKLIPAQDLTTISNLTGVVVSARVHLLDDVSGNAQEYPVDWSFKVNASPVFWDPDSLYFSTMWGVPFEFDALLKNSSEVPKVFTLDVAEDSIVSYPSWLEPITRSGTMLQFGESTVSFKLDETIVPGIYNGTVTASVDGEPVSFDITVEQLAVQPSWTFDPAGYQYSSTYVMQFSLDSTDSALSTDERDLIAAFVDGEIRGLANVQYLPEMQVYRAFMTVYSTIAGGGGAEEVSFRFWRALTGKEYMAVETSQFQSDLRVGSVVSPFILHPGGNFQVIPLKKGWNWISFNVVSSDMSRENVFRSILKTNDGNTITIKSRTNTAEYSPGSGWNGNLQNLNNVEGYLVHLSDEPDTLYVAGYPLSSPSSVAVGSGWIWLGYPGQEASPVDTVLQDLTPVAGDILKSQLNFAEYVDNTSGWEGSLESMEPGQGYKINLVGGGTITFRDPTSFEVIPEQWEYNMNITADLVLEGYSYDIRDLQMGIFVDGACRGISDAIALNQNQGYRYMALAHGNSNDLGKPVEIRLMDVRTGKILATEEHSLDFAPDALNGTVSDPVILFLDSELKGAPAGQLKISTIAPNPTSDVAVLYFETSSAQKIEMEVVDMNGQVVWSRTGQDYPVGVHNATIHLTNMPSGVYVCRLMTAGEYAVHKLVKH